MKKLLLLALALAGCMAPEASDPVAFTRQAGGIIANPVKTGAANARLGTSVAGCFEYNGDFVYGAPGTGEVGFERPDGGEVVLGFQMGVGEFSLCGYPTAGTTRAALAGSASLFLPDITANQPITFAVSAMAQADVPSGLSLIASASEQSLYLKTQGQSPTLAWADAGVSVGHSLAFPPGDGTRFAVTVRSPDEVKVFDLGSGQPSLQWLRNLPFAPGAVAFGNFHPAPGDEVAVRQDRSVYVYSTDVGRANQLVMILTSPSGSTLGEFGHSLAAEPNDAGGGLQALWVGAPGQDRVYRFLGDAGEEFTGPASSKFGWAIGFSRRTELVVGGPDYAAGSGAAFLVSFDAGSFIRGNAKPNECVVGNQCQVPASSNTCYVGTCVGGVLCDVVSLTVTACGLDAGLPIDAGFDAGIGLDAGLGFDAGTDGGNTFDAGNGLDAGADAGRPDSGIDAGNRFDGGPGTTNDAGRIDSDAGLFIDAGLLTDAGLADAGLTPDAGGQDAGNDVVDAGNPAALPTSFAAGCTCQSGSLAPLMLFALAWLRRRRHG